MLLRFTPKQATVIIFRLLSSLTVFINPFWGFAFSYFADSIDVVIWYFLRTEPMSDRQYHVMDKLVDNYMIIFGVIGATIYGVFPSGYLELMWVVFILRLVGTLIVFFANVRWILFFTPNFITWYLLAFGYMWWRQDYGILQNPQQTAVLLAVLLCIAWMQELVIHVFRLQPAKRLTDLFTRLGL